MENNIHFKSESNEWATPDHVFNVLNEKYCFTIDPCSTDSNHKCDRYYTIENDGLSKSWENERVFMNPPYGREIRKWVHKACSEKNCITVGLIPARTDTSYWHEYIFGVATKIYFVKGRLRFGNSTSNAPFPSAVVVWINGEIAWELIEKNTEMATIDFDIYV